MEYPSVHFFDAYQVMPEAVGLCRAIRLTLTLHGW